MTREALSSDETPLHAEIDKIISQKPGVVLVDSDLTDLESRRHPLAIGLTELIKADKWRTESFDLKLIEVLPNASAQRLKSELLRLAAFRGDLAYIAEAIVVHRHKSKVKYGGGESTSKTVDLLSISHSEPFPSETVNFLIDNFSIPGRRTASVQIALFKLLGSTPIRARLDDASRTKFLQSFLDPKNLPSENTEKARKALVSCLLKTKADFECLRSDEELFKKVSKHLAHYESDFSKGRRKMFFDWLKESEDRDLLVLEESWKDLGIVERLAVVAKGLDSKMEDLFYETLIAPQMNTLNAATLLKLAVSEPKSIARLIVESVDAKTMNELCSPTRDPKKKPKDTPSLLLHRAAMVSFSIAEDASNDANEAKGQSQISLSKLDAEERAHQATLEELGQAQRRVSELERVVDHEVASRRSALQSEIDLARFETLKELCLVHRGLLSASKLVLDTPEEFGEVTRWSQRALENLGVELFGLPGEILPRDLVLHEARSPKGSDVEILQVGYIMRESRVVVLPALAQPVAKG
jgi:hypothetical protein